MEEKSVLNPQMEETSVFNSPFAGFEINFGAKESNRREIHGTMDSWMDEVKMTGGAVLDDTVREVFKKRQEMMGKIVEQLIKEKFSDELKREIMICPNCGRMLNRQDMHERTVQTMIG